MFLPTISGNTSTIRPTISETISKNQDTHIQAAVNTLVNPRFLGNFQLNETKCKELRINFSTKNTTSFDPVVVNDMPIELVATAKILGLNVSSDLKWNSHIDSIIKKAQKRLYSLSQLKRSGLGTRGLVQLFFTCIRPVTEYTCPVFPTAFPGTSPMNLSEYKNGLCALFSLSACTMSLWLKQT